MRKIAPLLLVIAVLPVTGICEEFDWRKANAIAEVYADKAEECKNYYRYRIDSYRPACQYINDNYINNENNMMKAALKWSLTAMNNLKDNPEDIPYAEEFSRHSNAFADALTYIKLSQE